MIPDSKYYKMTPKFVKQKSYRLHSSIKFANPGVKYLSLPFTLFESYGAVFIMNSKIHLRKNSSNDYFKTISHYFHVKKFYSILGFIVRPLD